MIKQSWLSNTKWYSIIVASFLVTNALAQPQENNAGIKVQMQEAYGAFQALQPYMLDPQLFNHPQQHATIEKKLNQLHNVFAKLDKEQYSKEPGYRLNLDLFNQMLDDARTSFAAGRKSYALWRLRDTSNYCITCHTRLNLKQDFVANNLPFNQVNPFDQAEFYLATRQFDKAAPLFMQAATLSIKKGGIENSMPALRRWLMIYTRVHPNAQNALEILHKNQSRLRLSHYDRQQFNLWIKGLKDWGAETLTSDTSPLERAQTLISRASQEDGQRLGNDEVALLRATGLLHQLLESQVEPALIPKALYLLGVAYARLPLFYDQELALAFFSQVIEIQPRSQIATNAFHQFSQLTLLGYTGSAGADLPDEVKAQLKKLEEQAYGK